MPSGMETIQESLTHLKNVLGPMAKKKDQSINKRLAYVVEMIERVAGQYVDLAADVSRKMQVLEDEIVVLKKAIVNVPKGGGSSKSKLPELKSFGGTRSSKELENFF
jgi:hypothetical protein